MKQRYEFMKGVYFENQNRLSDMGYHVFNLIFEYESENDHVYECAFKNEEHILQFINTLGR